ncbi:hypothetical protein, partial [Limnohabitans sp.]
MRTFQTPRRSIAAPRFNAPSNTACAVLCALCLTSGMAQANPLMILGGINGVVDAVKRTTGSLVKESITPMSWLCRPTSATRPV